MGGDLAGDGATSQEKKTMSWAEDKARDILGEWADLPNDPVRRLVERAIRETIDRCAEIAACGEEGCGCEKAIRRAAED